MRYIVRSLVAAAGLSLAAVQPPAACAATTVDAGPEIAVVRFLAGSITPGEASEIRASVAALAAHQPREAQLREANARQALGIIAKGSPRQTARVRELYRVYLASQPSSNVERSIVERHDPTVAYDPEHQLIVTQHTLFALREASAWSGRIVGMAVPPDFVETERRAIAAGFGRANFANKLAYARIESSFPLALPGFARMSLAQQRAMIEKQGPLNGSIGLARDTAASVELVAAKTAGTQAVGYSSGMAGISRSGLRTNLIMQQIVERQMRQNIFQIDHPQCGPLGGNPSECQRAPGLQPLLPVPF